MKRKLAFLTALIMGMSAVSVTNVVDSDYITASAETTNPELPELKEGEARVIFTDYDTGEIIPQEIFETFEGLCMRLNLATKDENGELHYTDHAYVIDSNPFYCDAARYMNFDYFDVQINTPEGYYVPNYGIVTTKNDNGSLEIEFKLKKLSETVETGEIEGCTYTLSGNGTLTIDGYGDMCDFEKGTSPFCGNKSIRKVIFSKGITYVGENTFENCREDLVIYANENTGGQRYAKDNGIKFVSLGLRGDEFICNIVDYSGKIGDNITWNNLCGGYIILYGEGEMENFAEGESPFSTRKELIISDALILEGITSVGDYAFSNCKSLDVIKLSDSVNSIGKYAFSGCSLSILALPYSIESVDKGAFADCKNLKSVFIPYTVKEIGEDAFSGCNKDLVITGFEDSEAQRYAKENNIRFISLGKQTEQIITSAGECGENAIWTLDSEGTLTVSGKGDMYSYTYDFGAEKDKDVTPLFSVSGKVKKAVIEDGITNIGSHFFNSCVNMTEVSISDSVKTIGNGAFTYCTSLTDVTIPDSVTAIDGWGAFSYCQKLENVTIPPSVTSICEHIFAEGSALTTITGYEGTYAQEYSKKNGIKFISLGKYEELDKDTVRFTFIDYDTGELIVFGDEIDLIRIAAYIDGNDNLSALTIDTDSNPYIWKRTINADEEFSVGFTEFFVPDGYFVPDDYAKIKRYENGSIDVTLKLRKNDGFELPPDTVRVTVYDKDTNELIPDEVLKNHKWSFGTSICTSTGYTGPVYLLEKNKQIFIGDLTRLYKTADSFDFLCDYQPEVQCYENHSMDLVFKIKLYDTGDANCDGDVNMADAVLVMQSLANPDKYGITGADATHITEQGMKNADVNGEGVTNSDALEIQKFILKLIDKL